jgi:hypothetical protein
MVGVWSFNEIRSWMAVLPGVRRAWATMPEDYGTGGIPSSEVGPVLMITVGPNQVDIPRGRRLIEILRVPQPLSAMQAENLICNPVCSFCGASGRGIRARLVAQLDAQMCARCVQWMRM